MRPRLGGGRRYRAGVPLSAMGFATWREGLPSAPSTPPTGVAGMSTMPGRPSFFAKLNASSRVLTGPAGTPAASRRVDQWSAPAVPSRRVRMSRSSVRWATRSALVRKRSSRARPGSPTRSESAANCRSLPTAMAIGRSAAGKVSYGAMLGCALPIRLGTTPATAYADAWLTRADSSELSRFTSTCCPCPVASRCRRAARMPSEACRPVITSTRATPALTGSPAASPVTLIRPPTACTSRSYPGIAAPGPLPKPLIEQ